MENKQITCVLYQCMSGNLHEKLTKAILLQYRLYFPAIHSKELLPKFVQQFANNEYSKLYREV